MSLLCLFGHDWEYAGQYWVVPAKNPHRALRGDEDYKVSYYCTRCGKEETVYQRYAFNGHSENG